jgi:hydroxymethylbilane synthase
VRIATRGSALALAQARAVAAALPASTQAHELVIVTTAGDRGAGVDKARWVTDIEAALLRGDADLAVHSAKDVPIEMAAGLELAGTPAREDARDALVGAASLDALPSGARVGTSSIRRRAQLAALRPDLEIVDLRGNVDTRLRKLGDGDADALVLALAGLVRLGLAERAGAPLDALVPAPGQGALVLQTRAGEAERAAAIADRGALDVLLAERACARELGGSCETPLGANVGADGVLRAWIGLPDGSEWMTATGADAAAQLLSAGAADLLARAEAMAVTP